MKKIIHIDSEIRPYYYGTIKNNKNFREVLDYGVDMYIKYEGSDVRYHNNIKSEKIFTCDICEYDYPKTYGKMFKQKDRYKTDEVSINYYEFIRGLIWCSSNEFDHYCFWVHPCDLSFECSLDSIENFKNTPKYKRSNFKFYYNLYEIKEPKSVSQFNVDGIGNLYIEYEHSDKRYINSEDILHFNDIKGLRNLKITSDFVYGTLLKCNDCFKKSDFLIHNLFDINIRYSKKRKYEIYNN